MNKKMNCIKLICVACITLVSIEGFSQGKINRQTPKVQQHSESKPQAASKNKEQPQRQQSKSTIRTINGHEWVDLGLPSGLKWATCNLGASSPFGYGNYYAWGETKPKSTYTKNNSTIDSEKMRLMGDISGHAQYDAARANWRGSWRMPTKEEIEELCDQCVWTIIRGEYKGYKVTGPNGMSIFLPFAERCRGDIPNSEIEMLFGYYLCSTPQGYSTSVYLLHFNNVSHAAICKPNFDYFYGYSVRPVSN